MRTKYPPGLPLKDKLVIKPPTPLVVARMPTMNQKVSLDPKRRKSISITRRKLH